MERPKSKYKPNWEVPLTKDISDEGEWVKQLDSKIDAYWALKKLPPRQREVIQHRIDGYEYEEIAEKMGITVGTVNQYIAKASKKLCGIV